jgi:hypothetical protein
VRFKPDEYKAARDRVAIHLFYIDESIRNIPAAIQEADCIMELVTGEREPYESAVELWNRMMPHTATSAKSNDLH